ncbi:hypothetical protein B0H12DRAFT_1229078 [Mycena haematopus]|nr:hypothetical protein B0H12DRAFT_1229078 [Mycena haematopus]
MAFHDHCRFFQQDGSSVVGEDAFFEDLDTFDFSVPPYRLTAADLAFPASRPLFPVIQGETGLGDADLSQDEWKSVYFLLHPAVIRLLPFLRYPARLSRTSAEYLASLLNAGLHSFCILVRALRHLPNTDLVLSLIRGLLNVALHVQREASALVNPSWFILRMQSTDASWMARPPLPSTFHFPWVVEFAANHPTLPPQLDVGDHRCLAEIRSPQLEEILSLISRFPRLDTPAEVDLAVQQVKAGFPKVRSLFNHFAHGRLSAPFIYRVVNNTRGFILTLPEARRSPAWLKGLPTSGPAQRNFHFPAGFVYPSGPHEPLIDLWDHHQRSFTQESPTSPAARSSPPPSSPLGRLEGTSPMYEPSSPLSSLRTLSPASPRTMETNALLRDNTLTDDQKLDVIRSHVASRAPDTSGPSTDTCGESTLPSQPLGESREDARMTPAENTPPATQAFPSPPLPSSAYGKISSFRVANDPVTNFGTYGPGERRSHRPKTKPWRYLLPGVTVPPHRAEAVVEKPKKRPRQRSPGRSASRQATPKRASLRRSTPAPRKSRAQSEGQSEAGADVYVDDQTDDEPQPKRKKTAQTTAKPSPQDDEPRFPTPSRRGGSRSSRAPPYVPSIPPEPFNTPRLAEEILAQLKRTDPTLFDVGCASCMLRNRECSHPSLGTMCSQCRTRKLGACSHQFTVSDHLRGINFLEQYTRLSDAQGNRLLTAAMNARESYNLARAHVLVASTQVVAAQNALSKWITARLQNLGPTGIPGAHEIPEALCEDWEDMVELGRQGLAQDYELNLHSFPIPFAQTSDSDFRGNRDARLNSAITGSRELIERLHTKGPPARECTPAGPPDKEFLLANASAGGPAHLDFVGTASSSAHAVAGPSRVDYGPPTSPRSQRTIALLHESDLERIETGKGAEGDAMDLDAAR